jgi:RNA polymerase sigma factor (sigma-70 family)
MAARLLTAAIRLAPDPGPADGELLAAFAAARDETAFAELVRRHGGLVLAACRRVTGHAQDAEDAFQAAFLVLARRAGQVQRPEQLASWLYGVAVRTALDARAARRRIREQPLAAADPAADAPPGPDPDLAGVVDEELARLPEKYRAAVVLCELEGVSRKDAAARLRVPEGTLSSRLAQARKILAARLTRRGVVAPAGGLAALGPAAGGAAPPARLVDHTSRAAARGAGGAFPPGLVSDRVSTLTDGVLKAMLVSKLRLTAGAAALVVAALGAAAVVGQQPRASNRPLVPTADPAAVEQTVPGQANTPAAGKAAEKIAAKGIDDDDVPYPTVPTPAVVRVEEGKLVVRQRRRGAAGLAPVFSPPSPTAAGRVADAPKAGSQIVGRRYDTSDVLVFDMRGNRLAPKAWREKFQQDQHVLIAWGGVLPNPRELVLFKDDTLLVLFPNLPGTAEGGPGGYTARTVYQAVTGPDGSVYYQPVTTYELGQATTPLAQPTPPADSAVLGGEPLEPQPARLTPPAAGTPQPARSTLPAPAGNPILPPQPTTPRRGQSSAPPVAPQPTTPEPGDVPPVPLPGDPTA